MRRRDGSRDDLGLHGCAKGGLMKSTAVLGLGPWCGPGHYCYLHGDLRSGQSGGEPCIRTLLKQWDVRSVVCC